MRFYYEIRQAAIERLQRALEIEKAKPQATEESELLWEVGNLIEDVYKANCRYMGEDNRYLQITVDTLTKWEYEEMMDLIDDIVEGSGFELDLLQSRVNTHDGDHEYSYHKETGAWVRIYISSKQCHVVETGKFKKVPETKRVCKLIA